MKDLTSDGELEGNRYPLVGGPFNGQGLAKVVSIKKGRGKKALTVEFDIPEEIFIHDEDKVNGKYQYNTLQAKYIWSE